MNDGISKKDPILGITEAVELPRRRFVSHAGGLTLSAAGCSSSSPGWSTRRPRMRSNSATRAATVSGRTFWRVCMAMPSGILSGRLPRVA